MATVASEEAPFLGKGVAAFFGALAAAAAAPGDSAAADGVSAGTRNNATTAAAITADFRLFIGSLIMRLSFGPAPMQAAPIMGANERTRNTLAIDRPKTALCRGLSDPVYIATPWQRSAADALSSGSERRR